MKEHQIPVSFTTGGKVGQIHIDQLTAVILILPVDPEILLHGFLFHIRKTEGVLEGFDLLEKIYRVQGAHSVGNGNLQTVFNFLHTSQDKGDIKAVSVKMEQCRLILQ